MILQFFGEFFEISRIQDSSRKICKKSANFQRFPAEKTYIYCRACRLATRINFRCHVGLEIGAQIGVCVKWMDDETFVVDVDDSTADFNGI